MPGHGRADLGHRRRADVRQRHAAPAAPQEPPPPPPARSTRRPRPPARSPAAGRQGRAGHAGRARATGAPGGPVTTGDEELELTVPATARSASLRGGLRIEATAPGAGHDERQARPQGPHARHRDARRSRSAGRVSLKLKLTKAGRKAVKRLKGKKVQLRMTFTPKGGGAKLTTSARVTLR